MERKEIVRVLYAIYNAGFNHGINEPGMIPEHGTQQAFKSLIAGESPLGDGVSYNIKDKVDEIINPPTVLKALTNEYKELLTKNYKFQMGDDDFGPTTEEYEIIQALATIIADLSRKKVLNDR